MTLIVARIIDEKLYIQSDSKITGEAVVRNNPLESQLKALIIDSRLCLCYAGNINYAQEAYNFYINNKLERKDWDDFTKFLLKLNVESEGSTDFILGGYVDNLPMLLEIRDGAINRVQSSWIGSKIGFSKFQELYQNELSKNVEPKFAMRNGFEGVLESNVCDSIGNLRFSVNTNNKNYTDSVTGELVKVFEYELSTELVSGRDENIKFKEKGESVKIPSGNETTGSYAISYFAPIGTTENCVGVHFGYGKFGIFYPPKKLLNHIVYSSVNATEFIDKILCDYKITLAGMDILPGTMGIKYLIAGK